MFASTYKKYPVIARTILSVLALLGVGGGLLFIAQAPFLPIKKCNSISTELRFSCYRSAIEKQYGADWQKFLSDLENKRQKFNFSPGKKIDYAIFGTNCHTFYHAVGDFVATKSGDAPLAAVLAYAPTECTGGFVMGFFKRYALSHHFSSDVLRTLYENCPAVENQCAHEIGHLLNDKYVFSILKVLDEISESRYDITYARDLPYVTFENLDHKERVSAPFSECARAVPKEKITHCYTGIGHNMFLFAEFDPNGLASQFSECDGVVSEQRENCYKFLVYRAGINTAAVSFLSGEFLNGIDICESLARKAGIISLKRDCYKGIGGGIGLFVDSEFSSLKIDDKNFLSAKENLLKFINLCEKSDAEFVNECFAGLFGTRVAEFYDEWGVYHSRIETLRPTWSSDFEVLGKAPPIPIHA